LCASCFVFGVPPYSLPIQSPVTRTQGSTFRNRTPGCEAVGLLIYEREVLGENHQPTLTVFPDLSSYGQLRFASPQLFDRIFIVGG
jgi:hypothetical protein